MSLLGGLIGALAGGAVAVTLTVGIKRILAVLARQDTWVLLTVPLIGVALAVVVLHSIANGAAVQRLLPDSRSLLTRVGGPTRWNTFPRDVARADLTADVVATAGEEERFPWRLAPIRALAIVATIGLGAPMGTEAPVAHLGVATGSWLGSHRRLHRLVRPAAVGGGAAGVAALMGIPFVGTAFILELGRRRQIPLSAERVIAAVTGGIVGWLIIWTLDLSLINLVVPKVPPTDVLDAIAVALLIGAIVGAITAATGNAIHRARDWTARPIVRLALGGTAMLALAGAVAAIATPAAAFGPGTASIVWAETTETAALTLLAVALLRAAMTTAAVAAGGCGGVFVPFLAIGDIAGRVFAAPLGVSADLAGAAGAAAGIAGGYHLPLTATMMVLGIGGPATATLTILATVAVATIAAVGSARALTRLSSVLPGSARSDPQPERPH